MCVTSVDRHGTREVDGDESLLLRQHRCAVPNIEYGVDTTCPSGDSSVERHIDEAGGRCAGRVCWGESFWLCFCRVTGVRIISTPRARCSSAQFSKADDVLNRALHTSHKKLSESRAFCKNHAIPPEMAPRTFFVKLLPGRACARLGLERRTAPPNIPSDLLSIHGVNLSCFMIQYDFGGALRAFAIAVGTSRRAHKFALGVAIQWSRPVSTLFHVGRWDRASSTCSSMLTRAKCSGRCTRRWHTANALG